MEDSDESIIKTAHADTRWVKIRRPTVVVGGELTMDNLEIRHDSRSNVSEASIQLKSNCGCLLIDDFGRQRIDPTELLNRWIVPLENRHDFLTLATGKKIQVPFEQLMIFSTNLEPTDLADEAFLRRIPYKIEVKNPSINEFARLFEAECRGAWLPLLPGSGALPGCEPLRAAWQVAAAVPSARLALADQELLCLLRSTDGTAT